MLFLFIVVLIISVPPFLAVANIIQSIETFIYLLGALILISWDSISPSIDIYIDIGNLASLAVVYCKPLPQVNIISKITRKCYSTTPSSQEPEKPKLSLQKKYSNPESIHFTVEALNSLIIRKNKLLFTSLAKFLLIYFWCSNNYKDVLAKLKKRKLCKHRNLIAHAVYWSIIEYRVKQTNNNKITQISQLLENHEFLENLFRAVKFVYSVRYSLFNNKIIKKYYLDPRYISQFILKNVEFYKHDISKPKFVIGFLLFCNPNALKKFKVQDANGKILSYSELQLLFLEVNILFLCQFLKNLNRVRLGVNLLAEIRGLLDYTVTYEEERVKNKLNLDLTLRYPVAKPFNLNDPFKIGVLPRIFLFSDEEHKKYTYKTLYG